MRNTVTRSAAVLVAAVLMLTACSTSKKNDDKKRSSSSSSKSTTSSTPLPALKGVNLTDGQLRMSGKNGELSGVVRNSTKQTVVLRSVACGCAGMVQVGKPKAGSSTLQPISTGIRVAAGGTARLGGGEVTVRFSGLAKTVKVGSTVTVTIYFGTSGQFDAEVKVVG